MDMKLSFRLLVMVTFFTVAIVNAKEEAKVSSDFQSCSEEGCDTNGKPSPSGVCSSESLCEENEDKDKDEARKRYMQKEGHGERNVKKRNVDAGVRSEGNEQGIRDKNTKKRIKDNGDESLKKEKKKKKKKEDSKYNKKEKKRREKKEKDKRKKKQGKGDDKGTKDKKSPSERRSKDKDKATLQDENDSQEDEKTEGEEEYTEEGENNKQEKNDDDDDDDGDDDDDDDDEYENEYSDEGDTEDQSDHDAHHDRAGGSSSPSGVTESPDRPSLHSFLHADIEYDSSQVMMEEEQPTGVPDKEVPEAADGVIAGIEGSITGVEESGDSGEVGNNAGDNAFDQSDVGPADDYVGVTATDEIASPDDADALEEKESQLEEESNDSITRLTSSDGDNNEEDIPPQPGTVVSDETVNEEELTASYDEVAENPENINIVVRDSSGELNGIGESLEETADGGDALEHHEIWKRDLEDRIVDENILSVEPEMDSTVITMMEDSDHETNEYSKFEELVEETPEEEDTDQK